MNSDRPSKLEERTARLTVLIDPRKKAVFERLCAEEDVTASQVVRKLIRSYIEQRLGVPWNPAEVKLLSEGPSSDSASKPRRARR
jgi:ribbon-helix-helix protein